jgi:hypothetical protein
MRTQSRTVSSKSHLSPARRRLVEQMQNLNFGRIENLVICDGEPVFAPAPTVVREHKFGADNGPRHELDSQDFLLKAQVLELFLLFDELVDGTISLIEVKNGLPFRAFLSGIAD